VVPEVPVDLVVLEVPLDAAENNLLSVFQPLLRVSLLVLSFDF
jgi:hypothetical protein